MAFAGAARKEMATPVQIGTADVSWSRCRISICFRCARCCCCEGPPAGAAAAVRAGGLLCQLLAGYCRRSPTLFPAVFLLQVMANVNLEYAIVNQ
jgi:hypothetical protein